MARCNRLGIILDASHASDRVFDQLLEISRAPIVLSHSGCRDVYNHPRNLSDERLRKLAAKGGVIQVCAYGTYVAAIERAPERDAAHYQLLARSGGFDVFQSAGTFAAFQKERHVIEARFPQRYAPFERYIAHVLHALEVAGVDHVGISGDFDGGGGVEGFLDASAYPHITARLLAAGYTEADLAKIWSGNLLRVFREVEAVARSGQQTASSHPGAAAACETEVTFLSPSNRFEPRSACSDLCYITA